MLNDGVLHSNPVRQTNADYLARQGKFESNVRSYPRKLPLAIAKAQGGWVTDVEGNTYLDCLAGAGTLALGHNHAAIMGALDSFLSSGLPMHTLDLTTPVKDPGRDGTIACSSAGRPGRMRWKRRSSWPRPSPGAIR